jgi:hypothetical protein
VGVLKVAEYLFGFVYSIETLPYKLSAWEDINIRAV